MRLLRPRERLIEPEKKEEKDAHYVKGFSLISKVARGRKMRIQSRRSGRMVEESMDSLGIDSRWLDIRVTTGREEERSTTELLATSCKGKGKTTFRTFLLVQTFE
ncbi:hypothetical protein L1987_87455 [Smallanthus sonchifolius]|nr:hypothetical protein L1987_87455 [Smallanthus sonchifolius]